MFCFQGYVLFYLALPHIYISKLTLSFLFSEECAGYGIYLCPRNAWIGARDIEGTFKWNEGTDMTFSHWQPGQPDRYSHTGILCALIVGNGKWDDGDCHHKKKFICEH
jgi:hypothetical protein